jgi:hypothetical protein
VIASLSCAVFFRCNIVCVGGDDRVDSGSGVGVDSSSSGGGGDGNGGAAMLELVTIKHAAPTHSFNAIRQRHAQLLNMRDGPKAIRPARAGFG